MNRKKGLTQDEQPILDQFDHDVANLRENVKVLDLVSKEISGELERQNKVLEAMSTKYREGMDAMDKLRRKMAQLFRASGMSPMTMLIIFAFLLCIFLWFYWKRYA